jgi:competence protein ComGC
MKTIIKKENRTTLLLVIGMLMLLAIPSLVPSPQIAARFGNAEVVQKYVAR